MEKYKSIVHKIKIPAKNKIKQKNYLPSGQLPIIDQGAPLIGGYSNDISKRIICDLPVIIFGDHTKNVKYINFPFCAGADGIKILSPAKNINPKYLYYTTIYLTYRIEDKGYARHYQHIEKKELSIPPLFEQERIVAKIEELFSQLDAAVAELNAVKEKLAVFRQAVYSEVFGSLHNLVQLKKYFEVTGGLTKNSRRGTFPHKKPYLRVANVYFNKLDLTEIKQIGATDAEIEKCTLQKNDLLFVEGNGSKSQIGRVALWDGSINGCLHQNHIIKVRQTKDIIPQYALFYFMSEYGRRQILNVAASTSGLYTLSVNKVKSLSIPYCSEIEQREILNTIDGKLSICDNIEQTVNTALQQAAALRQSILKQAFEGNL